MLSIQETNLIFSLYLDMQSKVPGTISVEPGYYITNAKKAPNADGVLEWQTVVNPETLVPAMHIESYYGAAVAKVCEDPEKYKGRRLFVAGEYTSLKNMYAVIAASLGKKHTLTQVPRETYVAGLAKYTGPVVAEELTEMHEFFEEFGYYGGEPLSMAELGLKGTSVKDWISMEEAKALFK